MCDSDRTGERTEHRSPAAGRRQVAVEQTPADCAVTGVVIDYTKQKSKGNEMFEKLLPMKMK